MFERFRRRSSQGTDARTENAGADFTPGNGYDGYGRSSTGDTRTAVIDRATATTDRPAATTDRPTATTDRPTATTDRPTATTDRPTATSTARPATVDEARALQRERFGGADGTAIFFGWLSALGLAALLMAVVAAAGTRLGFATGVSTGDATGNAGTIGIVGAAILVAILLLAYFAGGYVAGRMARFDGVRQGFRVWLLGLLATIAAAVAGWIGGSQYNVLHQLNLPRIPVDEGTIATGAIITLAVALLGTLLAAVAGGKAGERYHRRVDQLGWARERVG